MKNRTDRDGMRGNCLVICLDGAVPSVVEKYFKKGLLPNIAGLVEKGTWAENCLPPFPSVTPICWATLATGASPGTHGVTASNFYDRRIPLDKTIGHMGYSSGSIRVETVWESAARSGVKTMLVSYPGSWPPVSPGCVQIGTTDTSVSDGVFGIKNQLFSTERIPGCIRIALRRKNPGRLEAILTPELETGRWVKEGRLEGEAAGIEPFSWSAELTRSGAVRLRETGAPGGPLAELPGGGWSPVLEKTLRTADGIRKLRYRAKILEASFRSKKLSVYLTRMMGAPLVSPASLRPELARLDGIPPYRDYFHYAPPISGKRLESQIDAETLLEITAAGLDWVVRAVERLQQKNPCRIVFVYTGMLDTINHWCRNIISGEFAAGKSTRVKARALELEAYRSVDAFIGKLLAAPGKNRTVMIASDHGAVSYGRHFEVTDALKQAGLLKTAGTGEGERVVLSESKAVYQPPAYVFVNLKGRNPGGIVEKTDYEDTADSIIAALYDYTDPATGKKPVALALKKSDAGLLGLRGERVGDVIVAVAAGFGKKPGDQVHGFRVPGTSNSKGQMKSVFIASGPGIKKNFRLDRIIRLEDIAPTMAHLMGFAPPGGAEGGIILQMLEEHTAGKKRGR